jgi:sugar-specific transcriptional regulator TrmB
MLEKYLQEIGLSEKEASVYLTLLQYDNASVIDVASKTKINRSTTYTVLESLAKKGLISETTVGKKTRYQAEAPERLETFVERQKIVLEEHSKRLKDIVPQIKSIQREEGERPVVKFFEGREGIISSTEEMIESEDKDGEIYIIYPRDLLFEIFTEGENNKFKKRRMNRQIRSKVIYTYKKGDLISDEMGDRVKIDHEKYPIKCDISIYKDRVRINTLSKSLSSIYIRSQDLADTLRSIFNLAHDYIKKEAGQSIGDTKTGPRVA